MLNTIVADELEIFADKLEKEDDFIKAVHELVKDTINEHDAIIFNGNGYAEEWVEEAEKRGLLNLKTAVDALPYYIKEENIKMFEHHKVYTSSDLHARYEILMQSYTKIINIEVLTMIEMVRKDYIPAVSKYITNLCEAAAAKERISKHIPCETEKESITFISSLLDRMYQEVNDLDVILKAAPYSDTTETAVYFKDNIVPQMKKLRQTVDLTERHADRKCWPVPSYGDIIFSVR